MNEALRRIRFEVPGEPRGKERPRYSNKSKSMYTPSSTKNYEKLIALAYRAAYGNRSFRQGEPLKIYIWAYFAIPATDSIPKFKEKQSGKIRPTKKPDWDNIGKVVTDALNGVAYHDDAQIVEAVMKKFYSYNPRLEIIISSIDVEEET